MKCSTFVTFQKKCNMPWVCGICGSNACDSDHLDYVVHDNIINGYLRAYYIDINGDIWLRCHNCGKKFHGLCLFKHKLQSRLHDIRESRIPLFTCCHRQGTIKFMPDREKVFQNGPDAE